MNPCRICGMARGGAADGERYCEKCDASLSVTLTPKQQVERRLRKVKRTDEGVFSRMTLKYWIGA